MLAHVPREVDSAHDTHLPSHGLSQQTPSTQKLLLQSSAHAHARPLSLPCVPLPVQAFGVSVAPPSVG